MDRLEFKTRLEALEFQISEMLNELEDEETSEAPAPPLGIPWQEAGRRLMEQITSSDPLLGPMAMPGYQPVGSDSLLSSGILHHVEDLQEQMALVKRWLDVFDPNWREQKLPPGCILS